MIAGRLIRAHSEGLPRIEQELDAILKRTFDLDNGMGMELLDIATFEILASMDAEQDPDGIPWPALSQGYLEYKLNIAPQAPIGVLFGVMKTWDQVAGIRDIWGDHAEMTYGTSIQARVEAVKFSEGGIVTGTAQPPRPFYGLTASAIARADALVNQTFATAW